MQKCTLCSYRIIEFYEISSTYYSTNIITIYERSLQCVTIHVAASFTGEENGKNLHIKSWINRNFPPFDIYNCKKQKTGSDAIKLQWYAGGVWGLLASPKLAHEAGPKTKKG